MKKMSLEEMVQKVDESKKVNPLDLSSDQDLSIALMNLVSLEEHFFFSGAKTGKVGFYDQLGFLISLEDNVPLLSDSLTFSGLGVFGTPCNSTARIQVLKEEFSDGK